MTACAVCGAATKTLLKCSRCKKVRYCGAVCQRKDWKTHKITCRPAGYGFTHFAGQVTQEILELLLRELSAAQLTTARRVCSQWRIVGDLDAVWIVLYQRRFFPKTSFNLLARLHPGSAKAALWRDVFSETLRELSELRPGSRPDSKLLTDGEQIDFQRWDAGKQTFLSWVPQTADDNFSAPEEQCQLTSDEWWLRHRGWRENPTSVMMSDRNYRAYPLVPHPLVYMHSSDTKRQLGYFEVEVAGGCSVGLVSRGLQGRPIYEGGTSHIGWRSVGYGYHSDDGSKWRSDRSHGPSNGMDGVPFGPPFGRDAASGRRIVYDIVGCGLDFETREMFFTLNGKMIGKAFDDVECQWEGLISARRDESRHQLYPAATLHEEGDRMRFNWGGRPFVFDMAPYLLKSTPIPEADAANEHEVSHAEGLAGIPVALMQQLLAMNDDELAEAGIGDAHDIEEGLYESSAE